MEGISALLLIAGSGIYPRLILEQSARAGVKKIVLAAFSGETDPTLEKLASSCHWLRVGQLGKLLEVAKKEDCSHAIMAGQIAPKNLYALRPDLRALMLLARLPKKNAETLFGAVASQLAEVGTEVLPATTFLEDHLAPCGHFAGPALKPRQEKDLQFGFDIAREVSRLDIGQTVVVKKGTVLAVEGFEGTNECLLRGGALGKGDCTMVKVSKPGQDMRFDVPVIGTKTLEIATQAGIQRIGIEAGRTLLLDRDSVCREADARKISLFGLKS